MTCPVMCFCCFVAECCLSIGACLKRKRSPNRDAGIGHFTFHILVSFKCRILNFVRCYERTAPKDEKGSSVC